MGLNLAAGASKYTLAEGQPCPDPTTALQIKSSYGTGGLAVLSDTQLIETLAYFARERIPERSVHAKAAGAWGEFEVLHDISDLTDARFLNGIGTKTKVLTRISIVAGEKGASDTVRDVRGWAMKFFTEEGNQDFVFNDLPVFFIRDPIKFPSMNRSHKRHPRTNVPDANMFWDFHVNNQEGIHALMHLFGQRGIPASLRHISGYGNGSFSYVKWHIKPDAGVETLTSAVALRLAGEEPDSHMKDLFKAIEGGDLPSWTISVQVINPKDVPTAPIDIFDNTFIWPHHLYSLRPIGRLTLKKNPDNYFQDIAFSPSNMVPGVGPSADIVLQARMFSYPDAARYRRNGPGTINGNYDGDPDYVRSGFRKFTYSHYHQTATPEYWSGQVKAYSSEAMDKDFEQPRELWKMICMEKDGEKQFLENIVPSLAQTEPDLRKGAIAMFARVDKDLGRLLADACEKHKAGTPLV